VTASRTEAAIACRALTKRYGDVIALDALDLDVPGGSVFGFLGPNGAGKTTTIRLLASLAQATSGEATLAGVEVGDGEPNRRGLFGYLDQDPRFHTWMTPRELLDLVGRLYRMPDRDRRTRIDDALETVGLTDAARRPIGTLSGGMRQRLGVAQAILNRPPILLLDEPVSSLDPEGRVDMLDVIRGLGGTSTVLFSTHILTDVERVCDRVAILDHGRLVTTGPMNELLERYARPIYRVEPEDGQAEVVARLMESLRAAPFVTHVSESSGRLRVAVSDAAGAGRDLLAMVTSHGVALLAFERQRPTLEDVFLQLVGRKAHEPEAAT
jgi:ABC-2 type transport system ATP-binding protein